MSITTVHGTSGEDRGDYTRAESRSIRRRSLRLLADILRPRRRLLVLTVVVVVVSTILRAVVPSLIAYGIDAALPAALDGDWAPILWTASAILVAGGVGGLLVGWYVVLIARLMQAIMIELRTRIFRHTQRLSLEFHEGYTSGRIISRQTSDLESIQELLDGSLNELVDAVLIGAFTLCALLLLDWQSALILCAAMIPLVLLMRWFVRESQRGFRATSVASAKLIVRFVETMTGIRAVQAFRKERRRSREFAGAAKEYLDANLRVVRLYGVFDPALMLLGSTTIAVVLLWGSLRVVDGTLAIGVLLAAIMYVRNFFGPLEEVATFLNSYQSAAAALEKVSGVLEEEPTVADPDQPERLPDHGGTIRFDEVEFGYGAGRSVLRIPDLAIPSGQTVALVGTTGAGKSTLAKLVARFYDPRRGAVRLDGVDLRSVTSADLRRAVVMVTQEAYLFSGSVADNIALGNPDASLAEIQAAARAVGAHEFIEALPDGYDTDVNKRGGRVSAGQRQLISFARAFLADPAVLILDEATASLDLPSERQVQAALQRLLADRTAIIIAHRLSTIEIADRVLVMEHGGVVEDGSPAQLIARDGRYARLHREWAATQE
ncbi:ABC transporter ATP-binding protein [Leucobacter triazinivorans]|uniref:ABC transporter ATP-binding protein n=1 Tax=Leucobacter triazinivorans TaxID=1784719 RepID=A0A4P6KFS2_9MICO|nr:ABC transporter ATP-binding protein [Leucobacter triazinivorans]QBE49287.1 ABC transporter ATP-binding protein [Leucobacter triazinivorans]